MSQTLLSDTMLSVAALLLSWLGPDHTSVSFWFAGVALYVIALLQDGIDRSAA